MLGLLNGRTAHDAVGVGGPDHDLSALELLFALLLQSRMVLLLNVVLVPIEQLLNRVATQQQETFLHCFLTFGNFVHVGIS